MKTATRNIISLNIFYMTKLTNENGEVIAFKPEILSKVQKFYNQLYKSHIPHPKPDKKNPRAPITRHISEHLPAISLDKIEVALGQLKNEKAPGEDGITTEPLKAAGKPVLTELRRIFNSVLFSGRTPRAWHRSLVVLFFKNLFI